VNATDGTSFAPLSRKVKSLSVVAVAVVVVCVGGVRAGVRVCAGVGQHAPLEEEAAPAVKFEKGNFLLSALARSLARSGGR